MTPEPSILSGLDLSAHLVIEASAGTGKTYTLEHLVVELVKRGASIDEILVVTFTEKATREMRVRIRARLQAESEVPRVRAQLAAFDRAPISTIHGFCQRLLTEHSFASGRFFEEERVDGRAAFGSALREVLRTAAPGLRAVLAVGLEQMGLAELEECLFRFHRETCPIEPEVDLAEIEQGLIALPSSVDVGRAVLAIEHHAARPRAREALPELLELAARARAADVHSVLPELFAWALRSEGRGSALERTVVVLAEGLADEATLGPPLARLATALASPVPLLVHVALPVIREQLLREKREKGLFDYDDLLSVVVEALRSARGPELVRAVRRRHRHALVDEFQDTDERQWEIFRRLFFEPDATERGRTTTLAVIGDPKQAIYGFRGADVHTYETARKEIEANGQRAVLDLSFRTSAALIAAVHRVLLPSASDPADRGYFTGINRYDAPVRAARPALGLVDRRGAPLPPLRLVHLTSSVELRARAVRSSLAEHYAEAIAALVGGEARVIDERGERSLEAADVMVLTRSSAEGDQIGEALRARGIPYAFFRKDGLFATDEAKDVLDVLRALGTPRSRALRARALLTPFFAVPVTALRDAVDLPGDHPIARTFEHLVELSEHRELAPMFRALETETGLARRELYLYESERRLVNYLHLFEVLLALSHRGHLSVRDLVERLTELTSGRARPAEDQDIQRLPSERSAVQILTVHKSKGLEAEAVFLFGGLGQRPPGEREPRVLHRATASGAEARVAWAGPMGAASRALAELEDDQEAERLYYVALTRARSLLTLPYVGPRPAGTREDGVFTDFKLTGPYRVVNRRLEALVRAGLEGDATLFARTELEIPAGRRRRVKTAPMPPRDRDALARAVAPVSELTADTVSTLRFALSGVEVTSYSRMKSRAQERGSLGEDRSSSALDEPERPDDEVAIGSEQTFTGGEAVAAGELPGGRAIGVMVHEVLERMPISRVREERLDSLREDGELLAIARAAAERSAVDPALAHPALALALIAQRTPVTVPGLSLPGGFAEPVRRLVEMPFVHPIPELGPARTSATAGLSVPRGYLRGVIDLLFEHEGRLFVLDWKTDRLERYDDVSLAAHVTAHYEVQARLYALACARLFRLTSEVSFEARFGGLVYAFLRGMAAEVPGETEGRGVSFRRPSFQELQEWETTLASSESPWGYPLPPRRTLPDLATRAAAPVLVGPSGAGPDVGEAVARS